ncbi:MAG: hypothetical protein BWY46_01781 [Firmicutes bacterium ADurb.Bin300]|nr:MAG: hypothetical protein BWY46_01781 [Firmicutes bacterium ADurb.Bin300]
MFMKKNVVLRLTFSGLFLALALVLPFLTGQIPQIGKMLCPMHLPVILCGFICGPAWGAAIGLVSPPLRFLLFSMPTLMPTGAAMAFELAVYGLVSGILFKSFPKKNAFIYLELLLAMIAGRIIWGLAMFTITGIQGGAFTISAFLAGAFMGCVPGIVLQIILIPPIIMALKKKSTLKYLEA